MTATPVVLTVLATLLAGQSSTQMSLAQYYRALAAQHQAKAADQWSFFQAKRIRGENFETTADLINLWNNSGPVDPPRLLAAADHLSKTIRQTEEATKRLIDELRETPDGTGFTSLLEAFDRLSEAARTEAAKADELSKQIRESLLTSSGDAQPDVAAAFRFLNPPFPSFRAGKFDDPEIEQSLTALRQAKPQTENRKTVSHSAEDPSLRDVLEAIRNRKTEVELAPSIARIRQETIDEAIRNVAADAALFDHWSEAIAETIRRADAWVRNCAATARAFYRVVDEARSALEELKAALDGTPTSEATSSAVGSIVGRADATQKSVDQVLKDFVAGRQAFTAWRYEVEARYNQASAELYEVQVRKCSVQSTSYLRRSWGYFYAQLSVQAAVTIATLALAVRQKSVIWSLACFASVMGLVYAIGVLLDAAPVPGV